MYQFSMCRITDTVSHKLSKLSALSYVDTVEYVSSVGDGVNRDFLSRV